MFDGNTTKVLDRECTLTIHDRAQWTAGDLAWAGYGQVYVNTGAVFDISTGGFVGSTGATDSADIYNQGTIRVNAPGQTVQIYGAVHHSGLIDVEAGDLQFIGNYGGSGALNVQPGARVTFSGFNQWQNVPQTGGGQLVFSGREQGLTADTTFSLPTTVAANFYGDFNLTFWNAVWQGGQISGAGKLVIPPAGTLIVQGQGAVLSRTLVNAGDIAFPQGACLSGIGAVTHTNLPGGTIHLASASSFGTLYSYAALVNQGSLFKDDGAAGAATAFGTVRNEGLVRSSAGRLEFMTGGLNLGRMEARGSGQILVQGFDFADSSSLAGDGLISLSGGTLRGTVETNVNLVLSGVTVSNGYPYSLNTLQVAGWATFSDPGGAEVRSFLTLNGGLYGGRLRSLQGTELSFSSAQVSGGSRLELLGGSDFVQGTLTLQDTNSTVFTPGTVRVLGAADLVVNPGAAFANQGTWIVSANLASFKGVFTDKLSRFSAANPGSGLDFGDGSFLLSGPVTASPPQLTAGPMASLSFSDLAVTNASVVLSQSSLTVGTNLSSSNAKFVLNQSSLVGPAAPWKGAAILTGQGTIQASLALQTLELDANTNVNELDLTGPLTVTETNAVLRTTVTLAQGAPVFPYLMVHGPVALNARFDLVAAFASSLSNLAAGPITVLESDQPITGAFLNATNGATLTTTTNSYRCEVFYGPDSPYGANKVVLARFGTAFDRWRLQRFTAAQMQDPTVSGPSADPDHIGFGNLAEFVLAMDPANRGATFPSVLPGPTGYSTIHLRKRKDVGGLQTAIALSPNLVSWQQVAVGATSTWIELHRAFDLGDSYDYTYLYHGSAPALFLKIIISGQYLRPRPVSNEGVGFPRTDMSRFGRRTAPVASGLGAKPACACASASARPP